MEPSEYLRRQREWFETFRNYMLTYRRLREEPQLVLCGNMLITEPNHYIIATLGKS